MTEDDTILGMSKEEFKETMVTSAIMATVGFVMTFVGLIVKTYVQEKIGG